LIGLYLLGDALDDIQLRNKATSMLFTCIRRHALLPALESVRHIWKSTASGSLLRKMVVDIFVSRLARSIFAARVSSYPADFVQEVAVAAVGALPTSTWDTLAERVGTYAEPENLE
jgi:hypothetical protein